MSAGLSRDQVAEAALALAADEGVDRVTMRGLGRALDVQAMSLYHWVDDVDGLWVAMLEHGPAGLVVAERVGAALAVALEVGDRAGRDVLRAAARLIVAAGLNARSSQALLDLVGIPPVEPEPEPPHDGSEEPLPEPEGPEGALTHLLDLPPPEPEGVR